jgi:hypothetical protein
VSRCTNPVAERCDIRATNAWRTRVEFGYALGEKARGGVDGPHRKKLVEACGDLDESLKKPPLRRVRLDEPARLPRLMGLEEGA